MLLTLSPCTIIYAQARCSHAGRWFSLHAPSYTLRRGALIQIGGFLSIHHHIRSGEVFSCRSVVFSPSTIIYAQARCSHTDRWFSLHPPSYTLRRGVLMQVGGFLSIHHHIRSGEVFSYRSVVFSPSTIIYAQARCSHTDRWFSLHPPSYTLRRGVLIQVGGFLSIHHHIRSGEVFACRSVVFSGFLHQLN